MAREGAANLQARDGTALNTPPWMLQRWTKAYGAQAANRIAAASLAEAPLDLSVKDSPDAWAERLGGSVLPTRSVRLAAGGRIEDLPGYADGAWWVQDAAAALPARLIGDVAGKSVVDLCAAPGGKTAQLAAAGAACMISIVSRPLGARHAAWNDGRRPLPPGSSAGAGSTP